MTIAMVTGGAGFIGSHLVETLVAEGYQVRVVDNLCTGNRDNLAPVKDKIEFFDCDINDSERLNTAMEGVEVVFHEAALASVPLSIDKPHEVNDAIRNNQNQKKLKLFTRPKPASEQTSKNSLKSSKRSTQTIGWPRPSFAAYLPCLVGWRFILRM